MMPLTFHPIRGTDTGDKKPGRKIVPYNIGGLRAWLRKTESFSRAIVSYVYQGEEVARVRRGLTGTIHRDEGKTTNNRDRGRRG